MNIIPKPTKQIKHEGFLEVGRRVIFENADDVSTVHFVQWLKKHISSEKELKVIFYDDKTMKSESYKLFVEDTVRVEAGDLAGKFYALITLQQLLSEYGGRLPKCFVFDEPHFSYRGFMLDVGRYFYPADKVKKFLDFCALLKLNYFHFHLTEDQGWRLPSDKYPLLTEKGSFRKGTNFSQKPHGGAYTKEELKGIVDYAHSLCIKVIPEIDLPGHTVSALACYPSLACFPRKLDVATHWGVKHDILCGGKEEVYQFVSDILSEAAEIFGDGYVHIGGDEAVKTRWDICPDCQKKIKQENLKDSEELQQYFMSRAHKYVKESGAEAIMWGWDAGSADHLDKDIIFQIWGTRNEALTKKEIESGRRVINAQSRPLYLDLPYAWNNLKAVYDYDISAPVKGLSDSAKKNVLGGEAPLWTEYVPDMEKALYMAFPRLTAFAESAWISAEEKDFQGFLSRLPSFEKLLENYGGKSAPLKRAMPGKLSGALSSLWFNRRVLHWQGLHNLVDNRRVKKKYGPK